jgi:dual specificity tyrosine-phosphorylation-regulated kinase 2/3/4
MMEVLGCPPHDLIEDCRKRRTFFDFHLNPYIYPNAEGIKRYPNTKDLKMLLNNSDDSNFVDFIKLCLTWHPKRRFSPEEAVRHEWMLEGFSRPQASVTQAKKGVGK